ncbi:hypothetical protein, partial [Bombilactobacillus bombi]|uniref:hypothetical protein n=1 Tax=Bombilactobacillus bombi TaxID=1303590 RepID=UPI001C639D79
MMKNILKYVAYLFLIGMLISAVISLAFNVIIVNETFLLRILLILIYILIISIIIVFIYFHKGGINICLSNKKIRWALY